MAEPVPFRRDNVPIVGQQFELEKWYPTIIIRCKCTEVGTVVVIAGESSSDCRSCGRPYRLNTLDYDRNVDSVKINLGVGAKEAVQ